MLRNNILDGGQGNHSLTVKRFHDKAFTVFVLSRFLQHFGGLSQRLSLSRHQKRRLPDCFCKLTVTDWLYQIRKTIEIKRPKSILTRYIREDYRHICRCIDQRIKTETVIQLNVGNDHISIIMQLKILPSLLH